MVLPIFALLVSFMTFCSLIELFRILRLKSFTKKSFELSF